MKRLLMLSAILLASCDSGDYDEYREKIDKALEELKSEEQAQEEEQAPAPAPVRGSGQFLWKPVSEGDGRLVILLPSSLRGKVSGVTISGSFGYEQGRFAGDTHNGLRPHYRFSKAGASYGTNIRVEARTLSGPVSWTVPAGSQRFTK